MSARNLLKDNKLYYVPVLNINYFVLYECGCCWNNLVIINLLAHYASNKYLASPMGQQDFWPIATTKFIYIVNKSKRFSVPMG